MKIKKIYEPFECVSIDEFVPSAPLVRAAAESFDIVGEEEWVKYGADTGQVQFCSKSREHTTPAALLVLDYIASNFDPSDFFECKNLRVFPDCSYYGGGMMLTPNSLNEGGFLGMHVDASTHAVNQRWKREYSAVLCISEEYDSSFDLRINNGNQSGKLPYKFNRLNVFKCSSHSWHGFPEITKGMNRKTLGVMYWSKMTKKDTSIETVKARFNKDLDYRHECD
jgi:hypothetical protein